MTATIDLAAAWSWILANWGPILTFVVAATPTILNGLTDFPDLATPIGKFLHAVGLLAILTHKDSPGTFKLPLTHSQEPVPDGTLQELKPPPKGFVDRDLMAMGVAWAVLIGAAVVLLGNCAFGQHVKDDVVQCSKDELTSLGRSWEPEITSILLAGAAGWQAQILSIASKAGTDVVGCIVAKLEAGWTPPAGTHAALPLAAIRAHEYLATQPQTFRL